MRFRPFKAAPPRRHRRSRKALSGPQGPALAARPLGYEPLEERALLTWNVAGVTFSPVEGAPVAEQAVANIIVDPTSGLGPGDFAATINWGDGTTNTADIVYPSASQNTTFAVLGTHTYSEEGPEAINVTVTHGTDTPVKITDQITVSDPAVEVTGGATFTAVEAAAPSPQVVATFSDPGSNEDPQSDYTATIAWGDGSVTAGTIAFNSLADDFSVTGGGDHVYAAEGSYAITVTVSHDIAPAASATSSATVSDPSVAGTGGYTYTGIEGGVAFNETVATFTDPAGPEALSSYSATIVWGTDPVTNQPITSAGTIKLGKDNIFTVSGTHAFAEETPTITLSTGATSNLAPISVVLNHGTSLPVTVVSNASISDAPLQMTGAATINASDGVSLMNVPLATFVDTGGAEQLDDYSAAINWDDDTTTPGAITYTPGSVTYNSGTFTVLGSHTYHSGGLQVVTITVSHDTAPETAVLTAITVSDPPVAATGNYKFAATEAQQSTSQAVATFVDPGGAAPLNQYSATIDWGDGGSTSAGIVSFNSISNVFTVSGQHTYAEEGPYPISVTIGHEVASPVTVTSTAAVADQPVVASGGATVSAVESQLFGPATLAVFTDPAGNESLGDYSATINWGDGTASPGSIVTNATGAGFSVLGSHSFTQTGNFQVGVTVHHDSAADVTVEDTVAVSLPPLTLTTQPLTWKEWTPLEAPDNALATISFVDSNTQVMINWGDGSSSLGTVTQFISGGAGAALGTHTWTETGSYTVTVTVTDGPSQATATLPVTVLKPVLPIPNPAAASANDYYVAELYEDILHRFVDGQGLQYWAGLLDAGAPLSAVSTALLSSDEYLTNFVIRPAYEKYLGRDADPGGITYWLSQMHAGLNDEGLAAALASSVEFYMNAGNTNVGYVDALYHLVLGRPADGGGESYWVGQLAAGESRFNVAVGFSTSAEDRTTQIDDTYIALLGRNPSLAELDQWLANFQSGLATNESLIASIAATDEYYARAVNE